MPLGSPLRAFVPGAYLTGPIPMPPRPQFSVFIASSEAALLEALRSGSEAWCSDVNPNGAAGGASSRAGGAAASSAAKNCALSPFGDALVAVRLPKLRLSAAWLGTASGGGGGGAAGGDAATCRLEAGSSVDWWRVALLVAGATLFLRADELSASTSFRISSGTLLVTAGSVLILLFLFMRAVPHKGKLMATLAAVGSTGATLARYLYGAYVPSLQVRPRAAAFFRRFALRVFVGAVTAARVSGGAAIADCLAVLKTLE